MIHRTAKKRQRSLNPNYDDYDFGFVIICPERNVGGLRNTAASIRKTYPKATVICVVGDDCTPDELAEMNKVCETVMGGGTITSLMNTGIHKSASPWNVLVFAGSWVRSSLYRKFDLFVKNERDILFPVVDGRYNFVEGSMNGIIMHKRALDEVGDFPTAPMQKAGCNELELIKLFWAISAMEKGYKFKAIIGMKIV